jgi:hypothetical protein
MQDVKSLTPISTIVNWLSAAADEKEQEDIFNKLSADDKTLLTKVINATYFEDRNYIDVSEVNFEPIKGPAIIPFNKVFDKLSIFTNDPSNIVDQLRKYDLLVMTLESLDPQDAVLLLKILKKSIGFETVSQDLLKKYLGIGTLPIKFTKKEKSKSLEG